MLKFYDVNPNYINFLKQLDTKVPDISYDTNNKFVCGTVLNIKEWLYCIHNEKKIQSKALSVYKMGTNEHHAMFKNCCNFKLLEEKYKEYNKENISPDINESMSVREKISKLNEENSHSETNTQQDKEKDV